MPNMDRFSPFRDTHLDDNGADLDRREEIAADRADRQRDDDYEGQCQEKGRQWIMSNL